MNHYAVLNLEWICIDSVQSPVEMHGSYLVRIAEGEERLGQKWTGSTWQSVPATPADTAAWALAQIDKQTGMSRTLRETLIALGEKTLADVAFLKAKEATAAAIRAQLK